MDYVSGRVSGVRDQGAGEFSGVPSVLSNVVRYVRSLPMARKSLTASGMLLSFFLLNVLFSLPMFTLSLIHPLTQSRILHAYRCKTI